MSGSASTHWDGEADILFPHEVTVQPPGTLNNYGRTQVSATAATTVAAHVEYKMRQVRDVKGEMTMSAVTVYLSGHEGITGITPLWTLTLPDGTARPILSIDRFADETGDLLEVVHLQ